MALDKNNTDRGYNVGRILAYLEISTGNCGLPNNLINNWHNALVLQFYLRRFEKRVRNSLTKEQYEEYSSLIGRVFSEKWQRLTLDEQSSVLMGQYHQLPLIKKERNKKDE